MNFSYSLTENALRFASKVAIVDGAYRYTCRDFNARVDGLARALLKEGLGPGSLIGILSGPRCPSRSSS